MGLSFVAAMGLSKGILVLKKVNPTAFATFKELLRLGGATLTQLSIILDDDAVSAAEIDEALDAVQGSGTGRLIIGYISGLVAAVWKR